MKNNNTRLVLTLKVSDGIMVFNLKNLKNLYSIACSDVIPLYATTQNDLISSVWVNLNNLNKKNSASISVNNSSGFNVDGCGKSRKDLNSNGFLTKLKRWFK